MDRIEVDFTMLALRSKHTIPDGWSVYMWEVKNHGTENEYVLHTGAIVTEVFKSGPRKGRKNWAPKNRTHEMALPITHEEVKASALAWAAETGNCPQCKGNGTRCVGWSRDDGNKYAHCNTCAGTGRFLK